MAFEKPRRVQRGKGEKCARISAICAKKRNIFLKEFD
jgi:hypothetical protein